MKTGSFWLLSVSVFIIGFINMGMQNNFSIYMTEEMGHTDNFSTNIFSLVMGIQILARLSSAPSTTRRASSSAPSTAPFCSLSPPGPRSRPAPTPSP